MEYYYLEVNRPYVSVRGKRLNLSATEGKQLHDDNTLSHCLHLI